MEVRKQGCQTKLGLHQPETHPDADSWTLAEGYVRVRVTTFHGFREESVWIELVRFGEVIRIPLDGVDRNLDERTSWNGVICTRYYVIHFIRSERIVQWGMFPKSFYKKRRVIIV